ncbi:MAG: GNAT family protein [Acidimicrobiales bacterium]
MGAAMSPDHLPGERVVLRRARIDDAEALHRVIHSPGVHEWWTDHPIDRLRDDLAADDEEFVVFMIERDGEVVGVVQYGQELDPQYRHASIDVSVLAGHHREGIASDAIRTLARHLIDDLGHHRIVIDPAAHNAVAIACYTSLGFRPVGVMRRYERGLDGTFHDGLLMDLLADELT